MHGRSLRCIFTPNVPATRQQLVFPLEHVVAFAGGRCDHRPAGAWRPAGIALSVGTVIIAVGCVYGGVHYVEDVVVGAVLGTVCGAVFWFALRNRRPTDRFLGAIDERLPGGASARPVRAPEHSRKGEPRTSTAIATEPHRAVGAATRPADPPRCGSNPMAASRSNPAVMSKPRPMLKIPRKPQGCTAGCGETRTA